MPFKKITSGQDKGKYRSPSGKVMTKYQMEAYLASRSHQKPADSKKKETGDV